MNSMKALKTLIYALSIISTVLLPGCGGVQGLINDYPDQRSSQYSANEALAARVHAALASDARVGVASLTIKVVNGVVELGGSPKDLQARDLALKIAARVSGVRSVLNNMVMN